MDKVTGSVVEARAGVEARAAGAYARAETLTPARPVEPVRPEFRVPEGDGAAKTGKAWVAESADRAAPEAGARPRGESGPGLLGALTNFLARAFGQPTEAEGLQASSRLAGLRTYARFAVGKGGTEQAGVELMSPSLPRLSSGRALDLSV